MWSVDIVLLLVLSSSQSLPLLLPETLSCRKHFMWFERESLNPHPKLCAQEPVCPPTTGMVTDASRPNQDSQNLPGLFSQGQPRKLHLCTRMAKLEKCGWGPRRATFLIK